MAAGTYRADENTTTPNGNGSRSATFNLHRNVGIYAGFLSDGSINDFNSRNPYLHIVKLSGDLLNDDVQSDPFSLDDNSFHVVSAIATSEQNQIDYTAVLDGFWVERGNSMDATSDPADHENNGAGILILGDGGEAWGSSPAIQRCRFEANRAQVGGAVFCDVGLFSPPRFYNCTFFANDAVGHGGAVFVKDGGLAGGPDIANSLFLLNEAGGSGGAAYIELDTGLTLRN